MESVVLFVVLFFLMALGHLVIKKLSIERNTQKREYRIVKAGCVEGCVCPCTRTSDIANYSFVSEGKEVRVSDYDAFVVDGNSMEKNGIHSGDIVLARPLEGEERLNINKDTILVFTYTTKDDTCSKGYKLRQFIDYIKMDEDIDVKLWCESHSILEETAFLEKYNKAKNREHRDSNVYICSKTWHAGMLSYSFHSIVNLWGKIEYCIPADKLN